MILNPKQTHIAYICPSCGSVIYGIAGKFTLSADLFRIKCPCGESALDINITNDKKIRLSVPCLFCKQNHNYVVSENIFFGRDLFLLNCPYANMDICFIGDKSETDKAVSHAEDELKRMLVNMELDDMRDLQPKDMDESEVLPDPQVYDTLRFLISELKEDNKINCPCRSGDYDLRFTDSGIQVYCKNCQATYDFDMTTPALAEEYLSIDSLTLK